MRNVFDQYSQAENRLTHALVSSLHEDRNLLKRFIRWVVEGDTPSVNRLKIVEQQLPGEPEEIEEDSERRGLPDAWVHDDNEWSLLIESKIESPLTRDQLNRHLRTATRRGFSNTRLLALVVKKPEWSPPPKVKIMEWTTLYSWLRREKPSEWKRHLAEYMEILEGRLVADNKLNNGTLTVFSGIPFGKDYPYNYREAKRTLCLCMVELRKRSDLRRDLGMDPSGEGRPAITGQDAALVWDFLPLVQARGESLFTKSPHLTLSIQQDHIFASVTIPNGIKREFRQNMLGKNRDEFLALLRKVQANLAKSLRKVKGATPWVDFMQRHYPTQRSIPIVDARIQFDLRTAFNQRRAKSPVKSQAEWLEAVYHAMAKKQANLQLGVGTIFPYLTCSEVNKREILNHVARTWIACGPLIKAMMH